ncbi:flagellar hook assembly protein FlgD [Pseudomonas sp. LP_7_YM]|uniref:flagellar hook assembly protein FlgD n=1 Tax=Pseudomonas sp. LP_7_YM TaxID=2485137 RepID=UPI00105ECD5A|nr:flagellar hook assembly protein FlgD [Pseudomonas sp. LP_7_YM]TDV68017.1 flagellar basal-body rod modification protein FlgD [Pseudomonas sp. LP_7_YM]
MTVTNTSNDASTAFLKSLQSTGTTASTSSTSSTASTASTGTSSLGKDSFLKLLVTQMQNQNPLDPQDNSEFVAQLAQFSSLETMQNLSTTVDSISTQYQSSQALQASSLVGRSVVVDAGATSVDTTAGMTGSVVLPSSSTATTVKVYDSAGSVVRTLDLGSQSAGTASFTWDGKDESGETLASGNYSFVANGSLDGTSTALTTYLPATVNSVTMGTSGADMTLNLASGNSIALSKVQKIGI